MTTLILLVIFTIGISFLCSLLESTLLSTPVSYLTMKEDEGDKSAIKLKKYKLNIDRPLSSILILNTIVNTMGAVAIGGEVGNLYGNKAVGITSAIITFLILVFSEIIPKTIGANYWRSLTRFAANTIKLMIFITYPLVIIAEWITKLFAKEDSEYSVSREEVSAMVDAGEEEGVFEEDEREVIQNIIRLDDILAEEIMTPRVVAAMASESMTLKNFFNNQSFHHHSRILLYSDNDEYITGYVLRNEVLELVAKDQFYMRLSEIKRDISSFSEKTPISDIWEALMRNKEHICVIINEYGSFQGIVTLEDIIETIAGLEIIDEVDEAADMQEYAKSLWKKNSYRKNKQKKKEPQTVIN